jgi:hypothetical protein
MLLFALLVPACVAAALVAGVHPHYAWTIVATASAVCVVCIVQAMGAEPSGSYGLGPALQVVLWSSGLASWLVGAIIGRAVAAAGD